MDDISYYVNRRKNHIMYAHWLQRVRMKVHVPLSAKGRTLLPFGMCWGTLKNTQFSKYCCCGWFADMEVYGLVKSPWNVCTYCECNTKNCFILSKCSVWGPAFCGVPHTADWVWWGALILAKLGWTQVRELLCLLLRVSRASGAEHCAAVLFQAEPSWHLGKCCDHGPELVNRKGGAGAKAACLQLTRKSVSCWKVVVASCKEMDCKLQCRSLTFSPVLDWKH